MATSPDLLPIITDYGQPADVPAANNDMANTVQTALNKRANIVPATTAAAPSTGWAQGAGGYGAVTLALFGKLVVVRGMYVRTASLAVTDNTVYQCGVIPAGYRPQVATMGAASWQCLTGGITNIMTTQFRALSTGELQFVANVTGSIRTTDYVSPAGLIWWIP